MSEEFKVEIVNPEKSFLVKDDVSEVVVPAFEGEMGILKGSYFYYFLFETWGNQDFIKIR